MSETEATKAEEFLNKERTAIALREAMAKYRARLSQANSASGPREQTIDKHGFGFNQDERFEAFGMYVSLDSWTGRYGSSGCSTFLHVPDRAAAEAAFIEYLNLHVENILAGMADIIDAGNDKAKQAYAEGLRAELERLGSRPS